MGFLYGSGAGSLAGGPGRDADQEDHAGRAGIPSRPGLSKTAKAALQTGQELVGKHRVPFVPDPPFRWQRLPLDDIDVRMQEVTTWASSTLVQANQPLRVLHAALDLRDADRELERRLERSRSR